MARKSYGIEHVLSVETFGPKRRTILATHQGLVTLGTPLPDGGWAYAMVKDDGRTSVAEAQYRDEAVVIACRQLDLDPVRILGRASVERALERMAGS